MASSSKPQPPKKEPLPAPTGKPNDPATIVTISENPAATVLPGVLALPPEEISLSKSSHLTRQELLRRRLSHVKQLSKVYRDHYWASMEKIRVMHRKYYWEYGVSPYKEEDEERDLVGLGNGEGCGETNTNNNCGFVGKLGLGFEEGGGIGIGIGIELKCGGNNQCAFVGCQVKAMALTAFCPLHILSDPQQKLYKGCSFVLKSAHAGPIICGKPILRSTVPLLCNAHLKNATRHFTTALKKAGLSSPSSKLAPKFHVIVAEYVHQIKAKRRALQRPTDKNVVIKEESIT